MLCHPVSLRGAGLDGNFKKEQTAEKTRTKFDFYFILLEEECGIPSSLFNLEVTSLNLSSVENKSNNTACNGYCPRCDGTMSEHIRPINRMGVKHFLVKSFGDKYNGLVSPITDLLVRLNYQSNCIHLRMLERWYIKEKN